jgi:RHS repeat-associated protein
MVFREIGEVMRRPVLFSLTLGLCCALVVSPIISLASSLRDKRSVSNTKRLGSRFVPSNNKRARPLRAQFPIPASGQTSTLLPDGSWLLVGGRGPKGPVNVASIVDPYNGASVELAARLHFSREWHSATMLPDGRVLILGGMGANGGVVNRAEVYIPQTRSFELAIGSGLPAPRAYHSATLLPDGRLLIAGGVYASERTSSEVQLWDSRTGAIESLPGFNAERRKHRATLLSDGSVLFEGGTDSLGNQSNSPEIFSPHTRSFHWSGNINEEVNDNSPFLTLSLPADDARDVPIDSRIALLFSRRLRADTVNAETVTLNGQDGTIPAKVIPTENGKSAFVTPDSPLQRGVTYIVLVAGPVDTINRPLTSTTITFSTTGAGETQGEQTDPQERSNDTSGPDTEKWTPDSNNLNGNWHSNLPESHWQKLPPLQAGLGVTALAGQVLTLDGKPLQNVTLQIASVSTQTDNTGRFLLQSLVAGRHVLRIDGRTAGNAAKTYGVFRVGVEITGGKTDVLGYTIWMPKLDMDHALTIASPTASEVVATTPLIPGLELHLPPGTMIRGLDGETITQISITPIPVDRPPFPLPSGVNVPVFFTIQPGGAQIIPPRARVIYPNYTNERPGSRIDFWNYDPTDKGWYVYGRGTVTPDGRQVVPDPGVVIYEFSGIMINTGESPPAEGPCGDGCDDGDPVDLGTGLFVHSKIDLFLPDIVSLALARTYRPRDTASRPFGIGTTHPFQMFLWSAQQYREADLILPDGGRVHFERTSSGTGVSNAVFSSTSRPGPFYKAELRWMGFIAPDPAKIEMWHLTLQDGNVYVFGENAPLQRIRDRYGNTLNIARAGVNQFGSPFGNVTKVTSPSGKYIEFTYDTANRITKAKDNTGREVNYEYASGRLWKVTDAKGGVTEYTYDTSHRMLTIKDPRGIVYLTNEYDSNGRVLKQTLADDTPGTTTDNPTYQFAYATNSGGKVTQTDVTDPRGNVRRVTFNDRGYSLTDTLAVGKPEQQTYSVERQAETNIILSATDPLGRKTAYTYDSVGRVTSVTNLALTSEATSTRYTYDNYGRILPATITDPLGRVTSFAYQDKGALLSSTDPVGRHTEIERNENGLATSITTPLGAVTRFEYQTKIPLSVTDPLGRTTHRHVDEGGRTLRLTNSANQSVNYEYSALNEVLKITDPLGSITEFTYDPNGNPLTVKDPRQKIISYTYDSMDRLQTRTDQLQGGSSVESYGYDLKGNVVRFTDRRGKITVYGCDNLDRLNFIGFGETAVGVYESTINYTYDAGNRLLTAVDSLSGTIVLNYDSFDRVLTLTTPQGAISYTYDKVGRRKTMTVPGQAVVNYTYDNADRLISVSQGTATVSLAYDEADRLATQILPNGVVAEFDYDLVSQLTRITYKLGDSILGNLTYEYDQVGRRIDFAGSYSRTSLPQTVASTTYNDANRLSERESLNLSYDANGNLTSDGTNTYVWDARNQLISITGAVTASFQYDAFGRRINKTINGQSMGFLYDGADVVQEQSGGSPAANLLVGDLDSLFTRADGVNSQALITDGLGSTLALLDSAGTLQTEYTYEPFGKTTISGAQSGNQTQYTGRENDGTGLYFLRARYYSPTLQRFISEDPLRLESGDTNFYSYVSNDPINWRDPLGLEKESGWLDGIQAGLDIVGFVPGVGDMVDLINGEISAFRGNNEEATYRFAAAIPVIGTPLAIGKLAKLSKFAKVGKIDRERRLLQLVNDVKVSSADRGWIKSEIRQVQTGNRCTIRNPPGKDLRHPPKRSNAQGYDYSETQLQDRDTHRKQHRFLIETRDGTRIRRP